LAILALAILAFAGCGGGGETTAPLTSAEFKAQANKICTGETKKVEAEVEEYASKRNLQYRETNHKIFEEEAEEIIIPSLERKLSRLQELEGPPKDERELAKIVTAAEKALQEGRTEPLVLVSGQGLTEVRKLAAEYGLKECF
jgi:hypothetical protein